MEEFDVKQFVTKINELKTEHDKLLKVKGRYIEYAQKLRTLADSAYNLSTELFTVAKEIDPVESVTAPRKRRQKSEVEEMIRELGDKMLAGTHITKEFILTTYPE